MRKWSWINIINVVCLCGFLLCWAFLIWMQGNHGCAVLIGVLTLIGLWSILRAVARGLRPTTRLERFKEYMVLRAVGILVGGPLLIAALWKWGILPKGLVTDAPVVPILIVLLWLAASLYSTSKIQSRFESLGAYKRRVGYQEDDNAVPEPPADQASRQPPLLPPPTER